MELGISLDIPFSVGVGFSHGTMSVGTSLAAAQDVWKVRLNPSNTTHILNHVPVPSNILLGFTLLQISQEQVRYLDGVVWRYVGL